jgi:hypothetical protein
MSLYPQKLALTSPTSGGRSVCIVRSRTQATELVIYIYRVGARGNVVVKALFYNSEGREFFTQ